MTKVSFANVPQELACLKRWVLWIGRDGKKMPVSPNTRRPCSVNDPIHWATLDYARSIYEQGGYCGVGVVLNGDGLVALDLDDCVAGGVPSKAAMGILERLGVDYIEISPSGSGLRGFGYYDGDLARNKGIVDGVSVEVYGRQRYVTFTGAAIQKGPIRKLMGVAELVQSMGPTQTTQTTQTTQCTHDYSDTQTTQNTHDYTDHSDYSGQGGVQSKPSKYPFSCVPTKIGERNKCIFELARYLKTEMPDATKPELVKIVSEWHKTFFEVIGTKELGETLGDFFRGWEKVKVPYGETMEGFFKASQSISLPKHLLDMGLGDNTYSLIKLCIALQKHHADKPFFLSARSAGELLGVHYTTASSLLSLLVTLDILQLVELGDLKTRQANQYRLARGL